MTTHAHIILCICKFLLRMCILYYAYVKFCYACAYYIMHMQIFVVNVHIILCICKLYYTSANYNMRMQILLCMCNLCYAYENYIMYMQNTCMHMQNTCMHMQKRCMHMQCAKNSHVKEEIQLE